MRVADLKPCARSGASTPRENGASHRPHAPAADASPAAGCDAGRTVAANMAEGGAVQDAPSTPRLSSGTPCAAIGFRR
ncbi:MAG: hypothetical protein PHW08_14615, partial [Kiritimatiellae bacterium]|nr:hypothetical protein [Kiritimatiellia bacterium]